LNVLVTGGSGFIGRNLSLQLLEENHNVFILTRNRNNIPDTLRDCQVIQGNILDKQCLDEISKDVDVIFHQAGYSTPGMFNENLELAFLTNVIGFLNVLKSASHNSVEKVIFASSSSVYGDLPVPHSEKMRPTPANLYGVAKLTAEELARYYSERFGLNSIGLRYFSVYGIHEQSKGKHTNLITKALLAAKNSLKHPVIKGYPNYSRDYVFVLDVVQANLLAMNSKNGFAIYNVGNGESHTLKEVIQIIGEISGKKIEPTYAPQNKLVQKHTLADINKIKEELRYNSEYDIKRGLRVMWDSL
jgi:nucleoside-diphosphate-sugar epimerase